VSLTEEVGAATVFLVALGIDYDIFLIPACGWKRRLMAPVRAC
jgi:uncharacterized membrane protein YdfJ with MMPL/SSD domain